MAIANAHLYRRAQDLATLEERARLARELHDSVSRRLFSMVYEARAAAIRAPDPEAAATLQRLEEAAGAALKEMKALVYALRPKSLERDGLETTLRDHVEALRRAHGAAVEVRVHGEICLPPSEELALLRIAQEALHNALRHAPGARVRVVLEQDTTEARLSVGDWWPGFMLGVVPRTRPRWGS